MSADVCVVRVRGELDLATTPDFERAVEHAAFPGRLVIDLSHCTFVDSAAVRSLLGIARAQQDAGGSATVVADQPGILRVLDIAAVDKVVPIRPTIDAAL